MNSLEANPKWVFKNLEILNMEAKKELEHRNWLWSEFKKTQNYINRLHEQSIKEEEIFQEEMARALTNILSDYTYAKDPQTQEVFHLKDEFEQYWRDQEGNIIGFSDNIDEKFLEANGFKKLHIRIEGFGKW